MGANAAPPYILYTGSSGAGTRKCCSRLHSLHLLTSWAGAQMLQPRAGPF